VEISAFDGAGIEQPRWITSAPGQKPRCVQENLAEVERQNLQLRAKPIDFDSEGAARLKLLAKCPSGRSIWLIPTAR